MIQLVRGSPWLMSEFDPDLERLFDRVFSSWTAPRHGVVKGDRWVPACDVFLRDGDLVVRMELPGVDPDKDVQVTVEDGVLCVSGERRMTTEQGDGGYYRREWAYGTFQRGVPLPDMVSADDIKASYDKGVLEVVVPKYAALSAPKRVPVHAGEATRSLGAGGPEG